MTMCPIQLKIYLFSPRTQGLLVLMCINDFISSRTQTESNVVCCWFCFYLLPQNLEMAFVTTTTTVNMTFAERFTHTFGLTLANHLLQTSFV